MVGDYLASPENGFSDEFIANLSEEIVDDISADVERFSEAHSLWAVPNKRIIELYLNHFERVRKTTFECGSCGHDTEIPVDHSAGSWQHFVCPVCKCNNAVVMVFHDDGEPDVIWVGVEPRGECTSS